MLWEPRAGHLTHPGAPGGFPMEEMFVSAETWKMRGWIRDRGTQLWAQEEAETK